MINKGQITETIYEKQNSESLRTKEIVESVNRTVLKTSEYLKTYTPVAVQRETYMKVVSLLFRMTGMAPIVNDAKNHLS